MLEQLVHIIGTGGAHSLGELVQQLGVSDELLERMVEDLARMGYLKPLIGCEGSCGGCHAASGCATGVSGRAWVLTEAGRRIAK